MFQNLEHPENLVIHSQVKGTEQRCTETRNPNLLDVLLFCTGAPSIINLTFRVFRILVHA